MIDAIDARLMAENSIPIQCRLDSISKKVEESAKIGAAYTYYDLNDKYEGILIRLLNNIGYSVKLATRNAMNNTYKISWAFDEEK